MHLFLHKLKKIRTFCKVSLIADLLALVFLSLFIIIKIIWNANDKADDVIIHLLLSLMVIGLLSSTAFNVICSLYVKWFEDDYHLIIPIEYQAKTKTFAKQGFIYLLLTVISGGCLLPLIFNIKLWHDCNTIIRKELPETHPLYQIIRKDYKIHNKKHPRINLADDEFKVADFVKKEDQITTNNLKSKVKDTITKPFKYIFNDHPDESLMNEDDIYFDTIPSDDKTTNEEPSSRPEILADTQFEKLEPETTISSSNETTKINETEALKEMCNSGALQSDEELNTNYFANQHNNQPPLSEIQQAIDKEKKQQEQEEQLAEWANENLTEPDPLQKI